LRSPAPLDCARRRGSIALAGPTDHDGPMGRWLLVIFGALLVLVGVVWTLQGLGYLAGSVMTGVTLWAIIGPIVALVGLVLLVMGARRLRTPR